MQWRQPDCSVARRQSEVQGEARDGSRGGLETFRQPKVRLRISELRSEVANKLSADAALTLEQHMQRLRELRDDARKRGQLSAAITAEVKRGELMGLYAKRIEPGEPGDFARMTMEELKAFVNGDDARTKKPSKH